MEIAREELEEGYRISHLTCDWALICIFGKKADISLKCRQDCEIAQFRLALESDSPAFFEEFLRVSDAHRRLHNCLGGNIETVSYQQLHEAQVGLRGLKIFVQSVFLALRPPFLANDSEFPFLTPEEVQEEREAFLRGGIDSTAKRMAELNAGWYKEVCYKLEKLEHPQEYTGAVFFLIRLFLRGIRKEREKLFQHIEKRGQY